MAMSYASAAAAGPSATPSAGGAPPATSAPASSGGGGPNAPPAGPEGPVPSLLSALRDDNRSLVTDVLRLGPRPAPRNFVPGTSAAATAASSSSGITSPMPPPVTFRQRLVFADDSLRTLILRHVLGDEAARTVSAAAGKKAKGKKQPKKKEPDEEEHPPPKGLGVVGTRLLFARDEGGEFGFGGSDAGVGGMAEHHQIKPSAAGGTEVSLAASEAFAPDASAAEGTDPRDATDGAEVVVYFLRPDPRHVRAACARLRRYQQQQQPSSRSPQRSPPRGQRRTATPTTTAAPLRHRVVFLPHRSALCDRILTDEAVSTMDAVDVHACPVDLVPLDSDLLSMETDDAVRRAEVDGVPSDTVTAVARSLNKVQDAAGLIRKVQSLGPMGEAVVGRMFGLRLEEQAPGAGGGADGEGDEEDEYGEDGEEGDADAGAGRGVDNGGSGAIDAMLVLDRKVDMVTPMMTPLTYEGLIDEVLGIDCGFVRVDAALIEPPEDDEGSGGGAGDKGGKKGDAAAAPPVPKRTIALPLNDLDPLYAEVRNQHVEVFGTFLQGQAKALKQSHSEFTDRNRDLTEIHSFVKQIPVFTRNLRSLTNHIHLAELVNGAAEESEFRQRWQIERSMAEGESCYDALEDLIAAGEGPLRVLRLLCLQSLAGGGIKSTRYDALRRDVVQTFGYGYALVLTDLERAGLLRRRGDTLFSMDASASSPFAILRRNLDLIRPEVDASDPDDAAYVSSGYAPVAARLVRCAANGWRGRGDGEALRELPGRLVDVVQGPVPVELAKARRASPIGGGLARTASAASSSAKKPVLLVYFVGGVTFMEVAALRFLSARPSFPYRIVICATKIVNGGTLLRSLSQS